MRSEFLAATAGPQKETRLRMLTISASQTLRPSTGIYRQSGTDLSPLIMQQLYLFGGLYFIESLQYVNISCRVYAACKCGGKL